MIRKRSEALKKFGKKVKEYRTLANLTQEQLAEKCQCSTQTISGIETGYSFPSFKILYNLSEVLNVSLAYFFNFEKDNEFAKKEDLGLICEIFSSLDANKRELAVKLLRALKD